VAISSIPCVKANRANGWDVACETLVALLWALAWFASGYVLGFLFGIPKVIQTSQNNSSSTSATQLANLPYQMRVNTNLEEISDWLTKLIVGATLTQLVKLPGYVADAARFMARGMVETQGTSFAAAILAYFLCLGFLAGYILTRMFLSGAFALADSSIQLATIDLVEKASLPGSDGGPNDPALQKATSELATVPISDDLGADEANALARSALLMKDPGRALRAASIAISHDPTNADAQLNYAVALSLMRSESSLVLERLKNAHDLMPSDLDARSRENMYNILVYTALYQDPPQGFGAAIQYGEEFAAKYKPTKASIWINLACAYGQKYAWLKSLTTSDPQATVEAANKAIVDIQQALAIDSASKVRLQQLTDETSNDNDLSALAKDNDQLRKLLDLPAVGAAQPANGPNQTTQADNPQH
jgi:hypothetical protein